MYLRQFFVNGCCGNRNTHAYQVLLPLVLWFKSLRSKQVVIEKSAQGHFLTTVVMETIKYTYTQNSIPMYIIVRKFEK